MRIAREIWRFFRRQWYMLPAGAAGVVLITLLHEGAHAAAVLMQGGEVTEFVWLPEAERWGHICFRFAHKDFSAAAISMAPYGMWVTVSLTAGLLSLLRRRWPFAAASWIFVWLYAAPLGDAAYAAFGWVNGSRNDFYHAYGQARAVHVVAIAAVVLLAAGLGFLVQRRLYGVEALSAPAYAILAAAALAALSMF